LWTKAESQVEAERAQHNSVSGAQKSRCDMTKRAVIYVRVSSDEQAKNNSLPSQREACLKYAAQNSLEVLEVIQEDYTGTVPLEARPQGRQAYNLLRHGEADALIVYRVDRLVRPPEDGDEWDMPILVRSLAKLGKEIHVCDVGQIKTDFVSLLLPVLKARDAGTDRRTQLERMIRGTNQKAQDGRIPAKGKPHSATASLRHRL
jgi:site-specific DNA recombinase